MKKPMQLQSAGKKNDKTPARAPIDSGSGGDPSLARALLCAKAIIDKKGENIRVLNVTDVSGFTDYFVVCSGQSDRQVEAISNNVIAEVRKTKMKPISVEGLTEGRWVLVDFGDVVVHVFLDALRDYYRLEDLWSDGRPIKIPAELFGQ